MGHYLAFDLGASSGRAIIGTLEQGKLSLQEVHRFPNGQKEIDGHFYWDYEALTGELLAGLGKALATGVKIDGISIDTWGVDYVFFDNATGAMRRRPYNYRDERTVPAAKKLWEKITPSEIYAKTGIQCMTLNTIYQLLAHQAEHPEDMVNSTFLNIPDALAFFLGGDFTAEYTHCSTTNLLDPVTRQWHWELIDRIGLPRSIFPTIVPACSRGGCLKKQWQEKFHCGAIPILKCGSHDTASAVLAVPAPEKGQWAYLSAGTWALLGAEIAQPLMTPATEKANVTNEGGIGGTIRFLKNVMGSWLFQELRRVWNESGRKLSFNDMEQMARQSAPCRYFINPNDAGFAAPGDMPGNIRAFCRKTGQGGDLSDAEVIRAVYDSLALYFRCKLEQIESLLGAHYQCLNIVGGGTKDGFLMQLTSDALGRQVVAGPVEATAAGNILGQAIAMQEISGIAEARNVIRESFSLATFTPDSASGALYEKALPRFLALTKE